MTIINHAFTSPIWMTSTLDNKKEIETKLNQANAAGYPVHLIDNEQEEKGKSLTWWPNNNDSAIFNNQSFDNQKINLSITINEFYNIAHDEQNRLLRLLLIKEGIINHDKKAIPAGELVNHVINYVARCKNDNSKISELARLLLKPLGQYGSGQNEQITATHCQTVIANWLQQVVFNTSADSWLLKKICDIKLQQHSLFHHDNLKQGVFNQLNSHIEVNQLSANVGDYYQQQVLSHIMPTLFLQPKNSYDQQRLQNMVINQPEWGYLHAGTALLSESGADFNSMSLDQIINIGMWLETMLLEEKLPVEYIQYFKLPALIHSVLKNNYQQITHEIDKAKMLSIYHIYFDHLTQHSKNNPFIQWVQRVNNWKSRPELARQQLIEHNVEQTWLNNYLYKNSDVKYHDRQGNAVVLPNIDKVFNNQNQQLADIFKQTELTLLPQVFNAFSEAEQQFIQQAQIYLVKAEFNAQGSVRSAPLPPPARLGMVASGALITRVPDSIDMLKCIFNGEERIYALQKQANTEIGRYQLYRVDYDKKAILDLFPHDHKIRDDDDYQLRLHVDSLLKQADEKPQVLLSSLSTLHRNRLAEKLQQEGYQPTIQQKVDTFFLHLIPFYTTITEARKGNTGQAVGAALFDVSGFFPFLAKAAHISNRFSIAVREAAVNGLQTALKQATFRQALHQGAKQLLKSGIPHVANSLPANLFAELGTAFLRSADPGFELLASGGLKGIHALKKVAKQSQQQLSGLTQLVEALEKKANDFPVAHSERFKIETAYHPAQLKEVPVTKIGRQSGKDIYVQVYPETGQPFGRKYLRDTAGNLALAPVPIGERLYQLKIQGLGGKGAKMGAKKLAAQSNTVQLEQISLNELKELLLTQQENTIIDLSSKNLHNIDFSKLFAEKIDLTFVNFSDANLSGSNLSNLNLTNATLHKASLNGAILHRVNLNNANLISVELYRAILNDAKLNNANLLRANLKETNLVNADLINADLTQATLSHTNLMHANLAHADLTQTDLSHANLQQVSIHGTNFSGAILDNTIDNFTLSLPSKWHEHNLEFELNHFNPQGRSILTSIDSIDDKYSQLKTKLALQVIHSLEHSTVNLTNVTPSLLDIFSKALFIKNPEINNFVDKLIENYLKKPSLQLINKLEAHPTMISAFLNYFDRQPYLMELAKYNDAFIQTLIATRTQGADSIKITANSLYKKYLHLPYIQQQLQHAEIKRLFDDQAGNGDWTKKEAANYLLLSPTKAGRVLIVSEKELTQMLHPNLHTNWNNIALFQHGKRLSPTEYSLSQCYKQDFPLFSHRFPHNGSDALMKKRPISFKSGKIVQKETNGALYTRAAQYIEYNNELFRVKNPFYSNYVAAEEVIMGGIFSMTGLDALRMLLCNDCDDFFIFNKKTRGDFQDGKNLSSFACVASQVEPSFKDLGDFLLDEKMMIEIIKKSAIEELLLDSYIKKSVVKYQSLREIFNKADCELTNILQKYPNKSYLAKPDVLAQIKNKNLIKFTMLEEMNKLLPQKLRDEQLKHFFVSRLLNNWDYLNFAFCNFGYFIDKRIHPTEFKGMTVDFGGSGTLGFGGLAKNESYQRAMQGARPENPLASTSLFTEKDANFSNNLPDSLTGISSVPRSRPLLSTIRGQVAVENNIFEAKDFNNFNKELMPALEVAYRLQVLPDHAIEDYLHENWLMGEKDFPYRDKDSKYNIDTAKIIAIIKDRKRSFIQYFGQDTIKHWEQNNILQAAKIRIEIADSLKRLMNKIYTIQPVSAASQTV